MIHDFDRGTVGDSFGQFHAALLHQTSEAGRTTVFAWQSTMMSGNGKGDQFTDACFCLHRQCRTSELMRFFQPARTAQIMLERWTVFAQIMPKASDPG